MRTHCITIDLANQGRRQVRARFDGGRMSSDGGALLVELFLDSHAAAPEEIVLDVDATDDPLHGRQEGRFFHGYYDCYCYLPLYVTCGPHLLCGRLRRSNRDAADGAVEELQRIVGQIRQRWPRVRVVVRGGRRVLPRRVDGVVRGGRGRRLRVRPGPERAAEAGGRRGGTAISAIGRWRAGAAGGGWWARRSGCRAGCAGTTSASW